MFDVKFDDQPIYSLFEVECKQARVRFKRRDQRARVNSLIFGNSLNLYINICFSWYEENWLQNQFQKSLPGYVKFRIM